MAKATKPAPESVQIATETLEHYLNPGATVYYKLETVNSAGTSKTFRFYVAYLDYDIRPQIAELTNPIAILLGYAQTERFAIRASGGGINHGEYIVSRLSSVLFPSLIGDQLKSAAL